MLRSTIVVDTCIAITFGNAEAISVVADLAAHNVVLAARAHGEITSEPARSQVKQAIDSGKVQLARISLDVADEQDALRRYDQSVRFRGRADAEVLALAESRGWIVGSDEIAMRRVAATFGAHRFAGTLDFLKFAVGEARLSLEEAEMLLRSLDVGPAFVRRIEAEGRSIRAILAP